VHAAQALLSVVAYRLINCLALTLPALSAHSSFASLLEAQGVADLKDARPTSPIAHARRSAVGRARLSGEPPATSRQINQGAAAIRAATGPRAE